MKPENDKTIIYKGRPCRIVSVSRYDALLEDEKEGSFFTVTLSELATMDRRNVEIR